MTAQTVAVRRLDIAQGFPPAETQQAVNILDKLRDLVISYTGLTLQEPEMFPQPSKWVVDRCLFLSTNGPP